MTENKNLSLLKFARDTLPTFDNRLWHRPVVFYPLVEMLGHLPSNQTGSVGLVLSCRIGASLLALRNPGNQDGFVIAIALGDSLHRTGTSVSVNL